MRRVLAVVATAVICASSASIAQAAPDTHPVWYVGGQSYMAGFDMDNGSPVQPDDTYLPDSITPSRRCYQNVRAPLYQLALREGAQLTFAACAGERPPHMDQTPQFDNGLQLDQLRRDTDVAFLGVIGNPELETVAPSIVLDPNLNSTSSVIVDAVQSIRTVESAAERRIIVEVRQRAPHAKVVLIGFPPILPHPTDDLSNCKYMTPAKAEATGLVLDAMNDTERSDAAATGSVFIDLGSVDSQWTERNYGGPRHDFCGDQPWAWGIRAAVSYKSPTLNPVDVLGWGFHPKAVGSPATQAVIERRLAEAGLLN